MINDVPSDQVFWLANGKIIKNILELARELPQLTQDAFAQHVNEEKNDFATWVEYSVKDSNLATLLRTTQDQFRMAAIVERRIQELTRIPEKQIAEEIKEQSETPAVEQTPQTKQPVEQPEQKTRVESVPPKVYRPTVVKKRNVSPLILPVKVKRLREPAREVADTLDARIKLNSDKPLTETHVHTVRSPHSAAVLLTAHVLLGFVVGMCIIVIILI